MPPGQGGCSRHPAFILQLIFSSIANFPLQHQNDIYSSLIYCFLTIFWNTFLSEHRPCRQYYYKFYQNQFSWKFKFAIRMKFTFRISSIWILELFFEGCTAKLSHQIFRTSIWLYRWPTYQRLPWAFVCLSGKTRTWLAVRHSPDSFHRTAEIADKKHQSPTHRYLNLFVNQMICLAFVATQTPTLNTYCDFSV